MVTTLFLHILQLKLAVLSMMKCLCDNTCYPKLQLQENLGQLRKAFISPEKKTIQGDLINLVMHTWQIQIIGRVSGDRSSCCLGEGDTFTF